MDIEERDPEPHEEDEQQPEGAWVGIDPAAVAPLEWAFEDYLKKVLKAPEAARMFGTILNAWIFTFNPGRVEWVAETHLAIDSDLNFLRSQGIEIQPCHSDFPEPEFD